MSKMSKMNQPAFPVVTRDTYEDNSNKFGHQFSNSTWQYPGITVRDYFAAKAMQGDIASMVDPIGERCGLQIDLPDENLNRLATLYYRMADAMMKVREL